MKKHIIIEALIFAFLIIAWRIGAYSLARLGDIMIGLGVIFFVIIILSLLGIRVLTGDVSVFLPLNKMVAIESMKNKPSISYILQVLGLGAIPIASGIIFKLFS